MPTGTYTASSGLHSSSQRSHFHRVLASWNMLYWSTNLTLWSAKRQNNFDVHNVVKQKGGNLKIRNRLMYLCICLRLEMRGASNLNSEHGWCMIRRIHPRQTRSERLLASLPAAQRVLNVVSKIHVAEALDPERERDPLEWSSSVQQLPAPSNEFIESNDNWRSISRSRSAGREGCSAALSNKRRLARRRCRAISTNSFRSVALKGSVDGSSSATASSRLVSTTRTVRGPDPSESFSISDRDEGVLSRRGLDRRDIDGRGEDDML